MEEKNILKNSQLIVLGLCIAAATVFSSRMISQAIVKIKKLSSEVIDVTGSAERQIRSDYMVWTSEFSRRALLMTDAFEELQEDLKRVKAYLLSKGIQEGEIFLAPVSTTVLYKKDDKGNSTNDIESYQLTQALEVRSRNVETAAAASWESTELIKLGIQYISNTPQYFYTKLSELKLEMIEEAARNAKKRAELMAGSTGNKIGVMRSAKTGVFQITPANSVEVADWGVNDTTSYEKKVTAVVHLDFAIA